MKPPICTGNTHLLGRARMPTKARHRQRVQDLICQYDSGERLLGRALQPVHALEQMRQPPLEVGALALAQVRADLED